MHVPQLTLHPVMDGKETAGIQTADLEITGDEGAGTVNTGTRDMFGKAIDAPEASPQLAKAPYSGNALIENIAANMAEGLPIFPNQRSYIDASCPVL